MAFELKNVAGAPITLDDAQEASFRAAFRGRLVTAGDATYDGAREIWNRMIDRQPGLIVYCSGVADVVAAVRFARAHGLMTSVRGGGHNVAGLSLCDGGMVIDLSAMRGVWVDPERRLARAQAGCLLADVDRETQVHGLATVLGFVSQTGIAGLTVGGGFGYLSRRAGWTSDNVVSMDVVTADGEVVRASESEHPDLFWALRGGGGAFGIVTAFEYRLVPCGPTILGGGVVWRGEDALPVLGLYAEMARSAPRELSLVAALRLAPPAPWLPPEMHGRPIVGIFACHSGDLDEGERLLEPLRRFGEPVADVLAPRPYTQMQSFFDATALKRRYYQKSEYFAEIGPAAQERAAAALATIASPHSGVMLFQIGGALNELPPEHSPVGNRDAAYVLNIVAGWDLADDDDVNVAWARKAWSELRPHGTGGAYLNFQSADEGKDRVLDAFGGPNLARLAALKERFDPSDFFCNTRPVRG